MEGSCHWKIDPQGKSPSSMAFDAHLGSFVVPMDAKAPIGRGTAATPKQLLLAAITGCTAMDVIGYLKKHRELPEDFKISIATEESTQYPVVFTSVKLVYSLTSKGTAEKIIESVEKSMTQYCGVSAMIAKACPITYDIHLNGQSIHRGTAKFS